MVKLGIDVEPCPSGIYKEDNEKRNNNAEDYFPDPAGFPWRGS